jgi:hypothetical protein
MSEYPLFNVSHSRSIFLYLLSELNMCMRSCVYTLIITRVHWLYSCNLLFYTTSHNLLTDFVLVSFITNPSIMIIVKRYLTF